LFFAALAVAICAALCDKPGLPPPGSRAAVAAAECSSSTLMKSNPLNQPLSSLSLMLAGRMVH